MEVGQLVNDLRCDVLKLWTGIPASTFEMKYMQGTTSRMPAQCL